MIEMKAADDGQTYGTGYIMWRLANSDTPLSVTEIADDVPISRHSVYTTVLRAFRHGWVVRRKRPTDGHGRREYEYAIAPRNNDNTDD